MINTQSLPTKEINCDELDEAISNDDTMYKEIRNTIELGQLLLIDNRDVTFSINMSVIKENELMPDQLDEIALVNNFQLNQLQSITSARRYFRIGITEV